MVREFPRVPHSSPVIRVLLIDDDGDDYVLTRALLQDAIGVRFTLEWESTFEAGLEAMALNRHDVYLLDYRLGARTGVTLLSAARGRGCTGPAIMLTGLEDRELDVEAMSAGVADYLVKGRTDALLLERSIRYAIERGRTLQEIERQRKELERSNAELEQFASIVSHDLRSPLQVISGYAELLAIRYKSRLDQHGNDYIRHILAGVARQDALICDLLTFARLEGGQTRPGRVDLNLAFDTAMVDLAAVQTGAGAVVRRGDLLPVTGNDVQIQQLLRNLIGNALKFRHVAAPVVEVTTTTDNGWVTVSVADNGPGIPPHQHERIFRMFQRGSGADQVAGTGIGLAVVKKIVERHHGRVWVDSDLGRGSTFHFTLPAA